MNVVPITLCKQGKSLSNPIVTDQVINKCYSKVLPLLCIAVLLSPADGLSLDEPTADIPAPIQGDDQHSQIKTTTGKIRDDELLNFICEQIKATWGQDVKLMVNSCYGGGLLDDMERVFGAGGDCEGMPWIGGSASTWKQRAIGSSDKDVIESARNEAIPKLGSTWTDSLAGHSKLNLSSEPGVIRNGSTSDNVMTDLQAAGPNDQHGPDGTGKETPQVASGNDGYKIQWNAENTKHEAVLFSGSKHLRHTHNVENVEAALEKTWENETYNIKAITEGSKKDLTDAIKDAATRLDDNTQLLLYFSGHGDKLKSGFKPKCLGFFDKEILETETCAFVIDDGWSGDFFGNYFSLPDEMPTPTLDLHIETCGACETWSYSLNGYPLEFPVVDGPAGEPFIAQLPIQFYQLRPGSPDANVIEITPPPIIKSMTLGHDAILPSTSLVLSDMDLDSGPINELIPDQVLLPGQSAAFFDITRAGEGVFVELLENGLAVVYVFSHNRDGTGQFWMAGLGRQEGAGIIVHDMQMPIGASFGPAFDPADVVRTDFGSLFFRLPTCGTSEVPGQLYIYPETSTNYEDLLNFKYSQLDLLADCTTGVGSTNVTRSGSYFDPSHSGEGIIVQVLTNGLVVVMWFTYDKNGNQMWMQGTGSIVGNTLTIDNLTTTTGTKWGSGFDSASTVAMPWGKLTIVFSGCGQATLSYMSTAGFGNGTLNMIRLTNLMGLTCTQ